MPGSPQDEAVGSRAAGVIKVVSDKYAAGWTDIAYDTSGRAIAANLDLSDGLTVRVVGAYGVSGSNCANFASFPANKKAEGLLIEFILAQANYVMKKAYI